ncbi:MAG: Ig-like domain-containing protein, partial [Spirochaetaceae bacterium]|nr:Ig-like domain-containing protein [Spirochaetaceae bacterium]
MNDKTQKKGSMLILAALAALLLFSCKNPLVGLGPRVDLNPPEGEVTGITNGDYVSGDITLTGTVEDDKEIAAVWATIDGSDVSGSFDAAGNWEIDIDTTTYTDGEREVVISLKDSSGKITQKQLLLFLDNTPPVIMVTSPDLSSPQDTSPLSIRGEAYDPLRLKEVRAMIGQGSIDTISTLKGTNDSWLFDISHSVNGTETLGIILEAEDEAGNVSQAVFHSNDLRYLNNDSSINIIDLYNLVDDQDLNTFYGTTGYIITPTDVDQATVHAGLPSGSTSSQLSFGAGVSGLPLDIDMSGDIPQITVTTPNPNIAVPGDTMGLASKVNGTVTDNVEVDETTVEIRFLEDDGTTEAITWAPVTILPEQIINDQNVNFSYSLPGVLPDANYYVQVRADDANGTEGETALIPFRLDGNAPVIDITSPALSAYIPDTTTLIEGTATDSEPILVEISLDGTNWETVTTLPDPGGPWSYQISDWEAVYGAGSFSDFDTIPISARATANGTTTYTNHSLIIDRVAPIVEFLTPEDSRDEFGVITGDVNGVVTLRVAVSDDSLNSVTHKIGINGPVEAVDSGSLYNWSEIVVTTLMEDPNLATEISPGIWELPVTVTAVDKAGNTTITADYTMIIDNAQDRPNVSVIYPIEGESYGGEVSVSGIATDDDGTVGAVYVQVDLNTPPAGTPDFDDVYTFIDGIDFDGTGAVTAVDESVAYQVTGLSSWSFPLNATGELYSTDAYTPGSGHNGDVHVKIWAEDQINSTVTSVPQVLHFRFDDTLPRVDSVEIDGNPVSSNAYVSGTVLMDITVSDDTQINKLEISYDNGVSWENQSVTPAMSILKTVSIDTAARVAGGNGILYLRIKATDNTGYTTLEVLPLNVDNNAPEGTYPGAEPIVLTGTTALLQGTASDPNGSIAGVDRIEVYLERGGSLYDPLSTAYDYVTNYNPDIAAEVTTFGAGIFYPANPTGAGVMIVDDVNELGTDTVSGDGDGYDESLTLVASTWNWWVKFNSENIPDGDLNIHYVVVDKAGNKTHYSKAARIENNPPLIESVRLGTDINYDNFVDTTVGSGETFRYIDGTGADGAGVYYVDFSSSFTAIAARNNRLFIDADESAADGNGDPFAWLWELYYKGSAPNLLGVGAASTTISDFSTPSMPDEAGVIYTLRVTDDAGLIDEVDIVLDLDNVDSADPTVTLYDLDLTHSAIIDARDAVGDGDGYAVPGYSPTASPSWESASGRLHAAGSGLYDGVDADVSGTIIVSGTVEDDKAINELELQISGYNGGLGAGNAFP